MCDRCGRLGLRQWQVDIPVGLGPTPPVYCLLWYLWLWGNVYMGSKHTLVYICTHSEE